jgi:hypothetical protein
MGALKNLHVFLQYVPPEDRESYLESILPPKENKELDWRGKYILASNFGTYCLLFNKEIIFE